MNNIDILKKYKNVDDRLLLSKILDKISFSEKRNTIEASDFLDLYQISLAESFLNKINFKNYILWGGYDDSERKMLFVFPPNYDLDIVRKSYSDFIKVVRITLNNKSDLNYEHRIYLGGIIKLGIKREKIGDILVRENGADIIVTSSIQQILYKELPSLKRFSNSDVSCIDISNLILKEKKFITSSIIISSLRLDNFVSSLAKTSRSSAIDLINQDLVFLNGTCSQKPSKQVEVGSIITIRRVGKFIFREIEKTTKNGNLVIKIDKYV